MVDHVHVVLGGERAGDAICRTMKCLYSRRVFPRSRRVQDFGWVGKCTCTGSEYTRAGVDALRQIREG